MPQPTDQLHRDMGRMEGKLSAVETRLDKIEEILERIEGRLAKIENLEAERRAERGLINTIVKSPLSYVLAAIAAAVAWVKGGLS